MSHEEIRQTPLRDGAAGAVVGAGDQHDVEVLARFD
jgi:hypothetical protein